MKLPTLILVPILFVACASSSSPSTREVVADAGVGDARALGARVIDAALLGKPCTAGCTGDLCANTTLDVSCPAEYCLYDKGQRPSYCTASCDDATCPDRYTCESKLRIDQTVTPSAPLAKKVCRRLPVACGDGVIEEGESCDDGNMRDDDGCSSDCSEVNPPRVDFTIRYGVADLAGTTVSYPKRASIKTRAPASGDPDGCGKVEIARIADGVLVTATVCDAAAKERVRFRARIPTAKGKLKDAASVEAYYASDTTRERKLRPFTSALDPGGSISVEVESMSQGGAALHGKLDAMFEPPSGDAFLPFGIAAEFVIVPPKG